MDSPLVTPRKAPRQTRAKATVEAILDAAAHILEDRGLAGFNTNAVAERAGVSIGSLYQYFPGKDAIVAALVVRDHEALISAIDAVIADMREAALDEALAAFARLAVAQQHGRPRLARLLDLAEERLPVTETMQRLTDDIQARVRGFLAAHGISAPGYVADDLLTIAQAMTDASSQETEVDTPALCARIENALGGYLDRNARRAVAGPGVAQPPM